MRLDWRPGQARWRRDDHGAVAILVAIFLIAFMALVAFVVDRGRVFAAETSVQNAVDAAALAAASKTCTGSSLAQIKKEARDYGTYNGVPILDANITVVDGVAGKTGVSVAAGSSVTQFFAPLLPTDSPIAKVGVAARATATKNCIPDFAIFTEGQSVTAGNPTLTGNLYTGASLNMNGNFTINGNVLAGAWNEAGNNYINVSGSTIINGDATATGSVGQASNITGALSPNTAVPQITAIDYATQLGLISRLNADRNDPNPDRVVVTGDCSDNDLAKTPGGTYSTTVLICTGAFTTNVNTWPASLRTVIADSLVLNGSWDAGSWSTTPASPVAFVATGAATNAINFGGSGTVNGYVYAPNGGYDSEGSKQVSGRIITNNYIEINGNVSTTSAKAYEIENLTKVSLVQ